MEKNIKTPHLNFGPGNTLSVEECKRFADEVLKKSLLEVLETLFTEVNICKGDDELVSSCNAEYTFDGTDCILTDGMVINSMRESSDMCIFQETAIRGANFLIVIHADEREKLTSTTLYVDMSRFDKDVFDKILNSLSTIDAGIEGVKYYMYSWRNDYLPNPYEV